MPIGKKINWSNYEKIDDITFVKDDFCETLDGGQSFRWYQSDDSTQEEPCYVGTFGKRVAKLKLDSSGRIWVAMPANSKCDIKDIKEYLDGGTDYKNIRKFLRDTKDSIMLKALSIHPTLRILRQSPSDAIIGFICSSSKRIVQIKQCVHLLAETIGDEIDSKVHALPTFEQIDNAPIEKIRACKLGFRADYLKKTARKICADKFDPMSLREIPYAEAKKYLISLSGVGDKVADCILLFGASRFEAFPVDTWIKKAMTDLYSTSEDADKIREFAAVKFGDNAGFAQQLIFAAKRKNLL